MTIWIATTALDVLRNEADAKAHLETGGVLVGYIAPSSGDAVITATIGPGPAAKHTPDTFAPDSDYQERELADIYEASGRLHTYLGDWHSHPSGAGSLSPQDLRTLRRIASYRPARIGKPLMLVAHDGPEWGLKGWQLTPRKWRAAIPISHAITPWDPGRG